MKNDAREVARSTATGGVAIATPPGVGGAGGEGDAGANGGGGGETDAGTNGGAGGTSALYTDSDGAQAVYPVGGSDLALGA